MPQDILPALKNPSGFHGTAIEDPFRPRLLSIAHDAEFVVEHVEHFSRLAVAANKRCGAWYWHPSLVPDLSGGSQPGTDGSVYFKSTDGHYDSYSFPAARANLPLLARITKHGGCIIVDATREGKLLPDALAKTVPIWCAVVNRARRILDPDVGDWDTELHLPSFLLPSERGLIEARMARFVEILVSLPGATELVRNLGKPLRPLWSTRDAPLLRVDWTDPSILPYYPVILVQPCHPRPFPCVWRDRGFSYLPGAGDDEENWARGITPDEFWADPEGMIDRPPEEWKRAAEGAGEVIEIGLSSEGLSKPDNDSPTIFTGTATATETACLVLGLPPGKHRKALLHSLDPALHFYSEHPRLRVVGYHAPAIALALLMRRSKGTKEDMGKWLSVLADDAAAPPGWAIRAVRGWLWGRHDQKGDKEEPLSDSGLEAIPKH